MLFRSKVAAAAGAAALTALTVGGTAPAQAASSLDGCPSTYVCIMKGTSTSVLVKWKSYGAHNLSNVTGNHKIVNNQTGGAKAYICKGYNGNDCGGYRFGIPPYVPYTNYLPAQASDVINFTPINSVYLAP